MVENVGLAYLGVFLAGACTAIGASAVFFSSLVEMASKKVLAGGLGFGSGVMLWVSFIEIIGKAAEALGPEGLGWSETNANVGGVMMCFGGMLVVKIMNVGVSLLDTENHGQRSQVFFDELLDDKKVPLAADKTPQEIEMAQNEKNEANGGAPVQPKTLAERLEDKKLMTMGMNTAIAIALHNFPEGLAGFLVITQSPSLGMVYILATAIHNIPEGLSVAVPIFYSTGLRGKAFMWGAGSGLAEPLGAVVCHIVLASAQDGQGGINDLVYAIMFGLVAGIMIMIVMTELLPTAFRYDKDDEVTSRCVILGMLVMAGSILLFEVA